MTTPQERVADAVRRGQETVNSTVRVWTDGVQKLVSNINLRSTVPTLEELVDNSYTFGVQVLAMQRDFTKSLLAYAQPWTETLSAAPKKAEQFVLRTERNAAKNVEDTAKNVENVAAEAEHTATKAQRSASARSRTTKS
jgi:acetyl-CoA carboxylase carboxyltransferase component